MVELDGEPGVRPVRTSARRGGWSRPVWAVLAVGLVASSVLAWASWRSHQQTEDQLTAKTVKEGASVLGAAVPAVEQPLATVAALVHDDGALDGSLFEDALDQYVGPEQRYSGAALFHVGDDAPVAQLGEPTVIEQDPSFGMEALDPPGAEMQVLALLDADPPRLGYAVRAGGGAGARVVYAEQALPADRLSVPQPDSAFAGMRYALYLDDEASSSLLLANTREVPLSGRQAREVIPFGDRELILVMSPDGVLGGRLLAVLPWLVLAGGAALSVGAAVLTGRLQVRRAEAEGLAEDNRQLYEAHRTASVALQRSLLPARLPVVEGFEIAAAYATGVSDTEVGGDWYDAVAEGPRLIVSVGDVSGRGLDAAAVMASLRFGMLVPATQGAAPETVLSQMSHLDQASLRNHFATVLCVAIDRDRGTARLANAGHPPALLMAGGEASWLETPVDPPIGVVPDHPYTGTTIDLPEEGTIVMVTDGLFERRGEVLDEGLERVRTAGQRLAGHDPQALADGLLAALTDGSAPDDAAVLAIRWNR